MDNKELHTAIRKRYQLPEWALFFEVVDAAGFGARRRADCLAFNLYPSRGLAIHGLEIKTYRGDWLRELKDPAKAEPIMRFCDRFWLCVPREGIAELSEIPETWGLLGPHGKKLRIYKEAPKLTPQPVDRNFASVLVRHAVSQSPSEAALEAARSEGREKGEKRAAERQPYAMREYEGLQKRVKEFEAASGVDIDRAWKLGDVGAAVKLIRGGNLSGHMTALGRMLTTARLIAEGIDEELKAIADLRTEPDEEAV